MKVINIYKDIIPYTFEIELDDKTYQIEIHYNNEADFFTAHLFKDNEILIYGEKIVFGNILFERFSYKDIPKALFVYTQSQLEDARASFENFNEDIFIFKIEDSDLNVD